MYLTIKQEPRLSKDELLILRQLSHTAKNLYNEALYNIRQYFFKNKKYLNYYENYKVLKSSDNYKLLNSNMSQQILKEVDGSFKLFFSLLKLKNKGKYDEKVKIPARLSYISERGEDINGVTTFEIHADILDKSIFRLRIGYSANAEIEVERKDSVLAIEESFVSYDPEPFVWVLSSTPEDVKHQKWEKQYVKTGLADGINMEISGKISKETIIRGRKK